jgi:hypothetical protein
MFKTSAYFQNGIPSNIRLLVRMESEVPELFAQLYRKNVVKRTPMKTGRLRRSIITQSLGNQAMITWRAPYARAQNEGGHTVPRPVRGFNPNTGRYSTIAPGFYRYRNYTTPGTGAHFAGRLTMEETKAQFPAALKSRGLTK